MESNPRWARNDTAVTFMRDGNLFLMALEPSGTSPTEVQLTDVVGSRRRRPPPARAARRRRGGGGQRGGVQGGGAQAPARRRRARAGRPAPTSS